MRLPRAYEPGARVYRIRYAISSILRDRVVNEGAFVNCFEMEDAGEVVAAILRRGLKNLKLRTALERSHIVNLTQWLTLHPEFSEAYHRSGQRATRAVRRHVVF
jgi:cystathionine beta-lyase/cystathionine gamma-synthase